MIVSLCLITFGVYLGQEYRNLPMVKNFVLNLVSYMHKLNQENKKLNSNEMTERTSSSPVYLSIFKKFYDLLNFKKVESNESSHNLSFDSFNENFFETNDTLRKRTYDSLENDNES